MGMIDSCEIIISPLPILNKQAKIMMATVDVRVGMKIGGRKNIRKNAPIV